MAKYKQSGVGGLSLVGSTLTVGSPATALAVPAGSAGTPGLQIAGDPDTGLCQDIGANTLSVACGGGIPMRFLAASVNIRVPVTLDGGVNLATDTVTGSSLGGAANQRVGMHGARIAQETVTGSRGANAALADLLTKLASKGIIVDGSS